MKIVLSAHWEKLVTVEAIRVHFVPGENGPGIKKHVLIVQMVNIVFLLD